MKNLLTVITLLSISMTSHASAFDQTAKNCLVSTGGTMNFEDSFYAYVMSKPKPYYFLPKELVQVLENKGYKINENNNRVSSFVLSLDAKDKANSERYKSAEINFSYHILDQNFPVDQKSFSVGPFQEAGSHTNSKTKNMMKDFVNNLPDCTQSLNRVQSAVLRFQDSFSDPGKYSCLRQSNFEGVLAGKLGTHFCSNNPSVEKRKAFFQCTGAVAQVNSYAKESYNTIELGLIKIKDRAPTVQEVESLKFGYTLASIEAYKICDEKDPSKQLKQFNKCIIQLDKEKIEGVKVVDNQLIQTEVPLLTLGKNKVKLCRNQIKDVTFVAKVKNCIRRYEDPADYIDEHRNQHKDMHVVENNYQESKSFTAEICINEIEFPE